jgi:hypothetical protein
VSKKLAAILAGTIVISTVFLALMPHVPSALAQFSWTDTINLYKDVTAVYTDIRKITNNETVSVDVRVYLTSTEKIELLEYYRLSGNGTDFIIISGDEIPMSNGTYYGLEPGQALHFTVEAKGSSSLSIDDIVEVGVRVEFWSAEYQHDVAITDISLSKTVVGQGYEMYVHVNVQNQGNFTETFNVTSYADTTIIQTQTITDLASGDSTMIIFEWNTTGMTFGNYTIKAVADTIEEEIDTEDNTLVNGDVMVTIPGDVNGDRVVDIFDIGYISAHWHPGPPVGPLGYDGNADINSDGAVDIFDIGITSAHWGQSW